VTASGALLCVVVPAVFAAVGLISGRWSRQWGRDSALLGTFGALVAAVVELAGVLRDGPATGIRFLGRIDAGGGTVIALDLRSDQLSAVVAVAVGVVALCVQLYSVGYFPAVPPTDPHNPDAGTPEAPTRYPAYAATVTLFTSAMMLVVHAGDLTLLLIGWETMGIASYLLVGHHSERASARAAAVKAFLVTRVGDLGVLLAVVILIVSQGTTTIATLAARAQAGDIDTTTLTAALVLLLAGVAGKSAQFPLHTWLPDAMEGPTPVSALIHAATMVAAGVFLVARLLPLYLAVPGALAVAAVIASITMLGAALAALAQEDLKRLLAWSTISQVAYMLAGVAVAQEATGTGPGIFHLLSHAAFKALLFLVAGCVIHLTGSTLMRDMGGLLRLNRPLAWLFGLGLAALAGLPPVGGFWSKEAVLTAADEAAHAGMWTGWLVLVTGLLTSLLTGLYAGRAWSMVALGRRAAEDPAQHPVGDAVTEEPHETPAPEHVPHRLPLSMTLPLWVLAIPTAFLGLVLVNPPDLLAAIHVDIVTGVTGALLGLAGVGWALSAPRLGAPDIADALPAGARALLRDGYRLDDVQDRLVVRPATALARGVFAGDSDVVDAYVRGTATVSRWGGAVLRRAQGGLATGYVAWLVLGAVAAGVAGMVLS
jgi:NADH-quinone oxidoreductase subunit L